MVELWLKQMTNLSVYQALFLIIITLFLVGLFMSIDYIDKEKDNYDA